MSPQFELRLLGGLELRSETKPVIEMKSVKSLALLSYLAMAPGPQPRSTLAGLLWGGISEGKARANLSKALSSLRQQIGDHLIVTRRHVTLTGDETFWLDVAAFEAAVNGESIQQMEEGTALYTGDFLDGFYVRDAVEFEQWMLTQQTRLRNLALHTLQTLAAHFAQEGRAARAKAMAYTERLLQLEPWREDAHRQLMVLLVEDGRRSAALAQFEFCRTMLAEELAVEPDVETVALFERIRDGEIRRAQEAPLASLPVPPRSNLPAQTTPFVGRETELAELDRLLDDSMARLVTILAPGGMGKTRLAIEAAARQLDNFRNGVFFVALAPISDPETIASAIAASVGYAIQNDGRTPREQLLDYLRGKAMLLVLDNAEHLLAGVGLFTEILENAAAIRLLVTSRERLHLTTESILALSGLNMSDQAGEGISAASTLFIQSAQRVRPGFESTPENWPGLQRICQLVMGMPLGLVLAASWIEMLSVAEIVDEIEKSLDFLAADLRDLPERQRSIRAVFESAWRRLSPSERDTFRRLSVFRGGFTREAAREVAGASLITMTALSHKSLIRRNPDGRFEVHELLRQFGADRLAESQLASQTYASHLGFFARFAEEAEPHVNGGQHSAEWLERVAREYDNFRTALDWALGDGDFAMGMRIVGAIWEFWMIRGHAQEGQMHAERYLARPEATQFPYLHAKALHTAGVLALYHGHLDAAHTYLVKCISLSRRLEAEGIWPLTMGLIALGHVLIGKGTLDDVEKLAHESLRLGHELDNALAQGHARLQLTRLRQIQGDVTDAEQQILESIRFFETCGNLGMLGGALITYSQILHGQGKSAAARAIASRSLAVVEKTNDAIRSASALQQLGAIAIAQGDYQEAQTVLSRALKLLRESGQSRLSTARHQGWQRRALKLLRETGQSSHLMHGLEIMGRFAMRQEDYDQAQSMLQESLAISFEMNSLPMIASILDALACLAARQGRMDAAAMFWGAADARATLNEMELGPTEVSEHEHWISIARAELGETAFRAAWSAGTTMTSMEMLEYG